MDHDPIFKEFIAFWAALASYIVSRIQKIGLNFEKVKNVIVDVLLIRRGANTSLFIHASILGLALTVLVTGGVLSSTSVISGSYPGVGANPLIAGTSSDLANAGVISSSITPVTVISDKPRDKVIEYQVQSGDTVSSIAQEHGVSEETVLWANDLTAASQIKEGQRLDILPVSGVAAKVESGDTIYSVAKKYRANAQAIIDFPFNDIGDDFQLLSGQTLIIPDGAPPEKAKPAPTQYLAKENIPVVDLGTARFVWPASGYGNRVISDHGNGYTTLYAHLSAVYVKPGQKVSKGEVVGAMGSTGRSSGTHLHIEIRKDGTALNPLSLLGK